MLSLVTIVCGMLPPPFFLVSRVGQSESGIRMGKGKWRESSQDSPTGMTVGGGRRQSICQLVLHRLQIVTTYPAAGNFI